VPGILGHILTGVRRAIGILWIVLVPCEMLGVSAGLGYYIFDTRDRRVLRTDGDGAGDRCAGLSIGCTCAWPVSGVESCAGEVM
jgi:hypothetical protein